MRATTIALTLPVSVRVPGRRGARTTRLDTVQALAFEHVAYHRSVTQPGFWVVTHRASALATAADLPTRDAARDLALTLERTVTTWPHRDERGQWVGAHDVAQVQRLWRIRTVGGHSLRRAGA